MAYAGKSGPPQRLRAVSGSSSGRSLTVSSRTSHAPGALATGVAIGLLVGMGVALLFAPRSGRETRHALGRGIRRAGRRGRDAWSDLRDELRRARRQRRQTRRNRQVLLDDRELRAD